ncbi:hypothetical protein ON010_g185 [Phytophthora cinnamomi]|nr:hypothetical protein ON010_g185 [Phytophthora cinnamomi]
MKNDIGNALELGVYRVAKENGQDAASFNRDIPGGQHRLILENVKLVPAGGIPDRFEYRNIDSWLFLRPSTGQHVKQGRHIGDGRGARPHIHDPFLGHGDMRSRETDAKDEFPVIDRAN